MQSNVDSMNGMSEMTSMKLQMTMDRVSKFYAALTNIMKVESSTASNIVGNMK